MTWRAPDWKPYQPPVDPDGAKAIAVRARSDDETGLWQRWKEDGDLTARGLLAQHYIPYAKSLARRVYRGRPHDEIQLDEYEQLAMVGLLESIDRFLPSAGAAFKTFAFTRIQGAIRNGLERLTERQHQLALRRRLGAERTSSLLDKPLSIERKEELLSELGEIGVGIALGFLLEEGDAEVSLQCGPAEDPYAQYELRQMRELLWQMVPRLTERERAVIDLHYGQSRCFGEIARMLGLGKSRVSQLHRQALTRLRALVSKAEQCDVAF